MLAGTVELGSLADAVSKQVSEWPKEFAKYFVDATKLTAGSQNAKSWRKVTADIKLIFKSASMLIPTPFSGHAYSLAFVWLAAVILSAISEAFCILYLAGVHVAPSGSALLSIVAVMGLIALLIVTPAIRTLVSVPQTTLQQFSTGAKQQEVRLEFLRTFLAAIPELEEGGFLNSEKAKALTKKFQSEISKATLPQRDRYKYELHRRLYARTRSSRPPRWVTRQRSARNGTASR